MGKIRLFVMDVDGTLTDGKIYMSSEGESFKAFNIKDGLGIHELLPQNDIIPIILTGRESHIVQNRAEELGVKYALQGIKNKEQALSNLLDKLGISYAQTAYIGDDLADYDVMKKCGVCGCPLDAVDEIKQCCDFVSKYRGGDGAVREFIEWIIRSNTEEIK